MISVDFNRFSRVEQGVTPAPRQAKMVRVVKYALPSQERDYHHRQLNTCSLSLNLRILI